MYDAMSLGTPLMLKTDFSTDFIVKAAEDQIGVFEGVASTQDVDLGGDIVKSGAFGDINAKNIPMLWAHDMRTVIGGWKAIDTKGSQMKVEGELNLDVAKGAEVYALMKKGHVTGLSIGFIAQPGFVKYDEKTGVRTISKGKLLEISVVPVPANDKARAKRVKSADGALVDAEEFKSMLVDDYGLSPEDADIVMTKGYAALVSRREESPASLAPVSSELKGILEALKGSTL